MTFKAAITLHMAGNACQSDCKCADMRPNQHPELSGKHEQMSALVWCVVQEMNPGLLGFCCNCLLQS